MQQENHLRSLIAIPVHNELKYVNSVLNRVLQFHPQVLVIDDGSTDGTTDLLRARTDIQSIHHPVNRGYGQSLIDVFHYADRHQFDWIITMDCDEQHEPEMIPKFFDAIKTDQWDLISGSRYLQPQSGDGLPPTDRRKINATITAAINDLFGWKLTDAFCGFKAHRVSAMRKLRLDEPGYAFPMQLWPQVWGNRLRLTEIPVRLIYNDLTRSFGAALDDADVRLRHYLDVLSREVNRLAEKPSDCKRSAALCGCQR
jgi:glycosyltransferase involved in cell wall biosynthesis